MRWHAIQHFSSMLGKTRDLSSLDIKGFRTNLDSSRRSAQKHGEKQNLSSPQEDTKSVHSLWTIDDYENFWGQYADGKEDSLFKTGSHADKTPEPSELKKKRHISGKESRIPHYSKITNTFKTDNEFDEFLNTKDVLPKQFLGFEGKLRDPAVHSKQKKKCKDKSKSIDVDSVNNPFDIFESLAASCTEGCQVENWLLQNCEQGDPKHTKLPPCKDSRNNGRYDKTIRVKDSGSNTSIDDQLEEYTLNLEHNKSEDSLITSADSPEKHLNAPGKPERTSSDILEPHTAINISISHKRLSNKKDSRNQDDVEDLSRPITSYNTIDTCGSGSVQVTYRRTAPSFVSSSSAHLLQGVSDCASTTIVEPTDVTNSSAKEEPVVETPPPRKIEPPKGPNFSFYAKLKRPRHKPIDKDENTEKPS